MTDWSQWDPEDVEPDLEDMTPGAVIDAYRERFGAATLPHMVTLPNEELRRLFGAMRRALRTGRPIPASEQPGGPPPPAPSSCRTCA